MSDEREVNLTKRIARLEADLAGLRERNARRFRELVASGAQIDLSSLLLETLIDAVFPPGTEERAQFQLGWERKVATLFDQFESEMARRVLLSPGLPISNGHH